MNDERKDLGKWWVRIVALTIATFLVFGGLNYLGVIGRTVVERKVFEQSYQRSEGLRQQIATYQAQLAELKSQLNNQNFNDGDRANIRAQISSINIQLKSARSRR